MDSKKIAELIRVDHAGEYGAKVIYNGQIAALKLKGDEETVKIVEEMKLQEDKHFDYFNQKIIEKNIRPTIMQPIWKVGGFAMGFLTALADKKAAMCCTTAVEEVIDQHYEDQLDYLKSQNKTKENSDLQQNIEQFQAEELEHRDIGYEHKADELKYFKPLSNAIKLATKTAIFISKKI